MRPIDLKNQRFGRLLVLSRAGTLYGDKPAWLCRCDCGVEKVISGGSLRKGVTVNCGCRMREAGRESNFKHGQGRTPLYRVWKNMRRRCDWPKHEKWHRYGGRGISVVPEWHVFKTFQVWALANGWRPDLQIDRIDNDGPYAPTNCRFVTAKENCNNRSSSRKRKE